MNNGQIGDGTEVRAYARKWGDGVELLVRSGDCFGAHVVVEKKQEGAIIDPTLVIPNQSAQLLLDDLWAAGFRPSERRDESSALMATERHLNDMRAMVFGEKGRGEEIPLRS